MVIFLILLILPTTLLLYCNASIEKEEGIRLPIIMYHSLLKEKSRSGKYTITPDTLKQDLEYIKSNGYTTINMEELINYVYNDGTLPEKPIIITFDDGYYNNFGYAIPILKELNMKAIISIVGEYTDTYSESGEANLNYGYIRWEDIKPALNPISLFTLGKYQCGISSKFSVAESTTEGISIKVEPLISFAAFTLKDNNILVNVIVSIPAS